MFMNNKEIKRTLRELENELSQEMESGAIPEEEVDKILSKYGNIGYAVSNSNTVDFCFRQDDDDDDFIIGVDFYDNTVLIEEIHELMDFVDSIHEWSIIETSTNAAIRIRANINGARQFALKIFGESYYMRTVDAGPQVYVETNFTIVKLVSTDAYKCLY